MEQYDPSVWEEPEEEESAPPPRKRWWVRLFALFTVLVFGAVALGGLAWVRREPPVPWYHLKPRDGWFSVDFPAEPVRSVSQSSQYSRPTDVVTFGLEGGQYQATVVYYNLPQETGSAEQILASVEVWLKFRDSVAQVLSQQELVRNGLPGREVELEYKSGVVEAVRFFVSDKRLYMISFSAQGREAFADIRQRFFESFRMLAEPVIA